MRIYIVSMLCLLFMPVTAQHLNALKIGDHFPETPTVKAVNYKDSVFNLSEYRNKLVILDFWATWCSACVGALPKLDSIQNLFGDSIRLVLVNAGETKEKIHFFLARYKSTRGVALRLPTVWDTQYFYDLVPHRSIPHYAWIYQGKLIATTGPDEINGNNISEVLQGKRPTFRMKIDVLDYNRDKPLLENGNGGDSMAFRFKTLFSSELPGLKAGYMKRITELHTRKSYVNLPMAELYRIASGIPSYAILFDRQIAARYHGDDKPLFCYEIMVPVDTPDSLIAALSIQDLNRFLNVEATIRIKKIPVWVLKMSGKRRKTASDTTNSSYETDENNSVLRFIRKPVRLLVMYLNQRPTQYPARIPFADETSYEGSITIEIPHTATVNPRLLRKILSKEDIRLRKRRRNIKVLSIRKTAF